MGLLVRKKSEGWSVVVDEISLTLIRLSLAQALSVDKKLGLEAVIPNKERVVLYPELFPQCGGESLALLVVTTLELIKNTKDVACRASPVDRGNWKGPWQGPIERCASKKQSPLAVGLTVPVVSHADLVRFETHWLLAKVADVQHRLLAKRKTQIGPARSDWKRHHRGFRAVIGVSECRYLWREEIGKRYNRNKAFSRYSSEVEAFCVGQHAAAASPEKDNDVVFQRAQRRDQQNEW